MLLLIGVFLYSTYSYLIFLRAWYLEIMPDKLHFVRLV